MDKIVSYQCSGDDNYCKGLLICLADPYGCSCYSGWYGTTCNISKIIFTDLNKKFFFEKVVHLIFMDPIVLINVHVLTVIDFLVFVIVMEQNVIKVHFLLHHIIYSVL